MCGPCVAVKYVVCLSHCPASWWVDSAEYFKSAPLKITCFQTNHRGSQPIQDPLLQILYQIKAENVIYSTM